MTSICIAWSAACLAGDPHVRATACRSGFLDVSSEPDRDRVARHGQANQEGAADIRFVTTQPCAMHHVLRRPAPQVAHLVRSRTGAISPGSTLMDSRP